MTPFVSVICFVLYLLIHSVIPQHLYPLVFTRGCCYPHCIDRKLLIRPVLFYQLFFIPPRSISLSILLPTTHHLHVGIQPKILSNLKGPKMKAQCQKKIVLIRNSV